MGYVSDGFVFVVSKTALMKSNDADLWKGNADLWKDKADLRMNDDVWGVGKTGMSTENDRYELIEAGTLMVTMTVCANESKIWGLSPKMRLFGRKKADGKQIL